MKYKRPVRPCVALLAIIFIAGVQLFPTRAPAGHDHEHEGKEDLLIPVRILMKKGRWEASEKLLKKLLRQEREKHDNDDQDKTIVEHYKIDKLEAMALLGILDVHFQRYPRGIQRLTKALEIRPARTSLWIYLAQARYAQNDFSGMLTALEKSTSLSKKLPTWHVMKVRGLAALGNPEQAVIAIDEGLAVFSDNRELLRERAMILLGMGLHSEAIRTAGKLFVNNPEDRQSFLVMGDALRKSGDFSRSVEILEQAAVLFPEDELVKVQLAYSYAVGGHPYPAARIFEKLTRAGKDYAFETADQYRLASRYREALRWNMKVPDRRRRMNQRLSIAVAGSRNALACTLGQEFEKENKVSGNTWYKLSYACMKHGSKSQATRYIEKVDDPALSKAVKSLRRAIETGR